MTGPPLIETSAQRIGVVIPALNEAENLPLLIEEVKGALDGRDSEIIIVDDGSSDGTAGIVAAIGEKDPTVRVVSHPRSLGQSAAVATGVRAATGAIIVTLDGDGQNDPRFIPELIDALNDDSVGLVAGQRVRRKDTLAKRAGSRIANRVRGSLLGDNTRDTGCGLKAFRRDAYLELPFFDALHRFMPALFMTDGWKVAHVDVVDRPRRFGSSNYGVWDRLAIGIPDLLGVWWLRRRRQRNPMTALRKTQI